MQDYFTDPGDPEQAGRVWRDVGAVLGILVLTFLGAYVLASWIAI